MIRRSWMAAMTGGSVEVTLELWALSLRDVKGRIRPLFQQERMAVSAGLFLDALLGPERRGGGGGTTTRSYYTPEYICTWFFGGGGKAGRRRGPQKGGKPLR